MFRQKEIVPVINLSDKVFALEIAELLLSKNINSLEITLRQNGALDCIAHVAKNSKINIGAGTVLSIDDANKSIDNGAKFLVSPGLDKNIANQFSNYIPGVYTATEIQEAMSFGINFLKFFPADKNYSIVNSYSGPFSSVKFFPTGGINQDNYKAWLNIKNVGAVGGSWMIDKTSLINKNLQEIERLLDESLS